MKPNTFTTPLRGAYFGTPSTLPTGSATSATASKNLPRVDPKDLEELIGSLGIELYTPARSKDIVKSILDSDTKVRRYHYHYNYDYVVVSRHFFLTYRIILLLHKKYRLEMIIILVQLSIFQEEMSQLFISVPSSVYVVPLADTWGRFLPLSILLVPLKTPLILPR